MNDITELAQSLKAAADREMICRDGAETSEIWERTVTPENILALVEALEKSEKTSEARREAIDRTHNMFVRERDRASAAEEALEKAQQRITQLESRTVKLPESFKLAKSSSGLRYYYADEVDAAIIAAGIKVEAE
ncbi:TPA: ead/Ea22-like family protein [Klebsiella pneumoniae]|uniref:ead/Ea22-like family protein n=1 Tax=Klebsiella pneumoniae TaxID=573 RepID=UPI00294597BC|nr:ead/Ea22-like family protein [Klebsiella pneumoniae]